MTRRIQAKMTRKRYSKGLKDEPLAKRLGVPTAAKELGLHDLTYHFTLPSIGRVTSNAGLPHAA